MGRPKSQLNESPSKVIEENHLQENPEGFPDENAVIPATFVPEYQRIQFINGRDPGVALMFHYHSKNHYLKHYTLCHGMEYDLPVEIIEHLEKLGERIYGYRKGMDGHPEMYVKSLKYVFQCRDIKRSRQVA